jgi:hypothetical protein
MAFHSASALRSGVVIARLLTIARNRRNPIGTRRGEGWPVGTIASQIHRHHDTVERVLAHGGIPITKHAQRGRLVDPYVPFIEATLAKYPRLRASRLWAMLVARGYTGSKSGFRAIVSRLRPRRAVFRAAGS